MAVSEKDREEAKKHREEAKTLEEALIGYRNIKYMTSGGYGHIYSAEHREGKRAIKWYNSHDTHLDDEEIEALTTYLNHPAITFKHRNLVQLHEHGIIEGSTYAIFDYAPGKNLQKIINSEKATWATLKRVIPPVISALKYLHNMNLVHGDVAPKNIKGTKLVDYDCMKESTTTASQLIFATVQYAAPEEAEGYKVKATDVYRLCATIYEALFGDTPAEMEFPDCYDGQEMLLAIRFGLDPRMPANNLTAPEWQTIMENGMSHEHEERASLEEIEAMLTRAIRTEIKNRTPYPTYKGPSFEKNNTP